MYSRKENLCPICEAEGEFEYGALEIGTMVFIILLNVPLAELREKNAIH